MSSIELLAVIENDGRAEWQCPTCGWVGWAVVVDDDLPSFPGCLCVSCGATWDRSPEGTWPDVTVDARRLVERQPLPSQDQS